MIFGDNRSKIVTSSAAQASRIHPHPDGVRHRPCFVEVAALTLTYTLWVGQAKQA
jgi:hypothetical protein